MLKSEFIKTKCSEYTESCLRSGRDPTRTDLGKLLGCSCQTVCNVVKGCFNGHPYGNRPSASRIVSNNDFSIIRNVFTDYGMEN